MTPLPRNCSLNGIILEGICGTGKSTVLSAVLSDQRWLGRGHASSIVLSEHQTQRVLEPLEAEGALTADDSLGLLDELTCFLENADGRLRRTGWLERNRRNHLLPFILERFHLTHAYHYNHLDWDNLIDIDARLSKLNAKIVLLRLAEEDIENRIIGDKDKNNWASYISRFGNTDAEIKSHFMRKQEKLLNIAEKSCLRSLIIDTSEFSVSESLDKIFEFWKL